MNTMNITNPTAPDFYADLVARCSRCGKCRSVCPVFAEQPSEPYVARGKVQLFKAMHDGKLEPSPRLRELISFCLLCGQCTENCPNGVKTEQIVLRARSELVNRQGLPFVKRNLLQHFLTGRGKLNMVARLIHLGQRWGLHRAVARTGLLPGWLGAVPVMAPKPLSKQLPTINNPKGAIRGKVIFFTGCMDQYVFTQTGKNVVRVLNRAGFQVIIPEQYCCGMPALTAGDKRTAIRLAQKNMKIFKETGVRIVLTDCATCGAALKTKYPELLGAKLPFEIYDICQFLVEQPGAVAANTAEFSTVTYHDPCHLNRHMGVREEPRHLLRSIAGLELIEMRDPSRCCGASGSFQLEHQLLAGQIGQHKINNILDTGADAVATGCPSCRMHLARLLKAQGAGVRVVHPVDLLA